MQGQKWQILYKIEEKKVKTDLGQREVSKLRLYPFNVIKLYHIRQYLTMCQKEVTLEQNAWVSKHAFKG